LTIVAGRGAWKALAPVRYALSQSHLAMPPVRSFQVPAAAAFVVRVSMFALLPVLALGCEEAPEPEVTAIPTPQAAASPALPRIKWLDAHGDVTPERWLASRAAHADLAENDAKVSSLRNELGQAAKRFGDPPRMIANRAVQLEEMLAGQGIDESAPELIKLLSAAASQTGPKEGFGSVCQHYFNLRQQGVGREAALEQLKETSPLRPNMSVHRG
jgi:hypothetical protein